MDYDKSRYQQHVKIVQNNPKKQLTTKSQKLSLCKVDTQQHEPNKLVQEEYFRALKQHKDPRTAESFEKSMIDKELSRQRPHSAELQRPLSYQDWKSLKLQESRLKLEFSKQYSALKEEEQKKLEQLQTAKKQQAQEEFLKWVQRKNQENSAKVNEKTQSKRQKKLKQQERKKECDLAYKEWLKANLEKLSKQKAELRKQKELQRKKAVEDEYIKHQIKLQSQIEFEKWKKKKAKQKPKPVQYKSVEHRCPTPLLLAYSPNKRGVISRLQEDSKNSILDIRTRNTPHRTHPSEYSEDFDSDDDF